MHPNPVSRRPPLELVSQPPEWRPLPADVAAERAALGCVLSNRESLLVVADWLAPDMFDRERHADIYRAMLSLLSQRITPDLSNVAAALGESERVYLIELLSDDYYIPSLIDAYAARIERAWRRRLGITAGGQIAAAYYDDALTPDEMDARAHTLLTTATAHAREADLISGSDAATAAWERLDQDAGLCVPSGWCDLDELTGGWQAGDYVVVGARPSVGKTSWALSLLRNVCRARSAHPLLFSLEMDRYQITHRLVAMEAQLSAMLMRRRQIPDEATHRLMADAFSVVGSWDWTICDLAGQSPSQIRARTMRHIAEHPQSIAIVDYLGLMAPDHERENRTQDVAALSLALRNLARDAAIPVIALAQLSRAPETRTEKRPTLSDFRDSGSIEQDATHALFLYRDELYHADAQNKGVAELSIAKNRFGPLGVVPMRFDATTTRFDTLSYRDDEEAPYGHYAD